MLLLKNRMDFKGSNNSNFCGVVEKSTWHPVSYDDADYDDDVPLSERLSRMSNLVTWISNRDIPLKKRRTTTMSLPVKRPLDNNGSLNTSVMKSKVSPYDNQDKEKDDTPLSRDFVSSKKQFEHQVKELQLKEKQLQDQVKEFKSKVERVHDQMKELESEKKYFRSRVKELELKERQLEGRVKELELKEEQLKCRVKELESEKKQFEGQLKDLRSKEKLVEGQVKEFQSIKEEFEGRVKEFESKDEAFNARMQKLKGFVCQMEDLKSEEKHFEGRGKEIESKDKMFKVDVKVLKPKEKQFNGRVKDLQSKSSKFDDKTELGNQLSPTIDERGLMLLTCDQTDELVSPCDDIQIHLQGLSDPSKVVLDIIQNPIIQKCKMGDDALIIDDSHILLLEEVMRISPDIRPRVREEAMKLALDLKANISENTENPLVVLGFLLLLSIYGLVPSFDEDEVLKLFELVSQHNIAVELFGALGFADKIFDFIENLIKRQKYDEAVRFSCAYNFSDNNQLVDLFQKHVQNLNLIFQSSCKEANSIEIKDKARDQEIASLGAVVQRIGDNNLESEELLNKIHGGTLDLKGQKSK